MDYISVAFKPSMVLSVNLRRLTCVLLSVAQGNIIQPQNIWTLMSNNSNLENENVKRKKSLTIIFYVLVFISSLCVAFLSFTWLTLKLVWVVSHNCHYAGDKKKLQNMYKKEKVEQKDKATERKSASSCFV